jgi:hypothetical protein
VSALEDFRVCELAWNSGALNFEDIPDVANLARWLTDERTAAVHRTIELSELQKSGTVVFVHRAVGRTHDI